MKKSSDQEMKKSKRTMTMTMIVRKGVATARGILNQTPKKADVEQSVPQQ